MLRRKFVFQGFNCIQNLPHSRPSPFPSFPFSSPPLLTSYKFIHKFIFNGSNRSFLYCYIFRLYDPPSLAYPAGFISISSLFPLPYLSFVIEETSGQWKDVPRSRRSFNFAPLNLRGITRSGGFQSEFALNNSKQT